MEVDKRKFLIDFIGFLKRGNHDHKCAFALVNKTNLQGWISDIEEDRFEYLDSGPEARDEPYWFKIEEIDIQSFSYWDNKIRSWVEYPSGKIVTPTPITEKKDIWYYLETVNRLFDWVINGLQNLVKQIFS